MIFPLVVLINHILTPWGMAEVDSEARRKMIREFEEKQKTRREALYPQSATTTPDQIGGLDALHEALGKARLEVTASKSRDKRIAAAQATINYVDPLVRIEQLDEAIKQINTSLDMGADPESLVLKLADIRILQAESASEEQDWQKTYGFLEDVWRLAKRFEQKQVQQDFATRLRNLQFDWAVTLSHEGKTADARAKAIEALTWKIEPEPIHAFLMNLYFREDKYKEAQDELQQARRGALRNDPFLIGFSDFMKREETFERSFRSQQTNNLILKWPSGMTLDVGRLDKAFIEARQAAEKMFKIKTVLPARTSIYQISDFPKVTQGPDWVATCSISGKLRLRADLVSLKEKDLRIVARYAFGLWVVDTLSDGKAPAWFQEGLAHQLACPEGPPREALDEIRKRLSQNNIPAFQELQAPFQGMPEAREASLLMAQSQMGIRALINLKGLDCMKSLLEGYSSGKEQEDALNEVTDLSYEDFFEAWKKEMNKTTKEKAKSAPSSLRSLGFASPLGSQWQK